MSRKLAAALALLIAVALLPIPALAAPAQMLDFTQEDALAIGENWTWDKDSKTLTLNGATLAVPLRLPGGATIVVNGTNSISVDPSQSPSNFVVGIHSGLVTITGTGTLNITRGTPQNPGNQGSGTHIWIGYFIVGDKDQSGPTVTMTNYLKGVGVIDGGVLVNSGSLTIRSTAANSGGIEGEVRVTGGFLDIEAMSGGIYGRLTVTGGNVKIKTLNDGSGDYPEGIALKGKLNVEGGVVWLTSRTPGGNYGDRFAPAILQEPLREEGLTVRGSTIYNDQTPNQTVTWKTRGPAVATDPGNPNNPTPGGPEQSGLYPFIGDTPAKTVKISAGDDSGSQSGIIIYVPTDDTPNTTTGNPTTGANDFVSTATAAALMALLGAAALLRK